MKTLILIADNHGYPVRAMAPATAAETVVICPHDKPLAHARPVRLPDEWLPTTDMPYGKKCWWRCELMFAAAVQQLELDADFFWCVEADVCAQPEVWQRLMAASETRALDGIYTNLGPRLGDTGWSGWWDHPGTPRWANKRHLGAMFRLSRRAMGWLTESAVECREAFCEIANASVVSRAGGSTGDLQQLGWFYNSHTMRPAPHPCYPNKELFNHPLKSNTEEPQEEVVSQGA